MTNKKEIIVHGVDVSECIFYKGYCRIAALCDYSGYLCEVTPNCNFKQLKRKERELEPFKDDYFKNLDTKTIAELAKKSIRLTTENRKLEDALDEIKNVIKSLENENILTFPDLSLQENVKAIMGQCNSGYKDILDIINKVKGGVNGDT